MAHSHDPKPNPGDRPVRRPPAHDDAGVPRRPPPADPRTPGSIEAPPSREPGPPPASDMADEGEDAVVEHEGATERQVGDRTGPGAGYDEER